MDDLRAFPRGWMEGHGAVIPKGMDGTQGPGRAGEGRGGDGMGQSQGVQGIREGASEVERKISEVKGFHLRQSFPKCAFATFVGVIASSLGNLCDMLIFGSHLRPTESAGWGPAICFNKLSGDFDRCSSWRPVGIWYWEKQLPLWKK